VLGRICLDLRNPNVGEGLSGKVEMSLNIFTDDRFLMMTSNIVPFDSISIEVVQHSNTRLRVT
jgi:hypothetical protein